MSCNSSFVVKKRFISLMAVRALLDFLIQCAMWSDHCSFWSKMTPKTFNFLLETIWIPFKFIVIGAASLQWNKHRLVCLLDAYSRHLLHSIYFFQPHIRYIHVAPQEIPFKIRTFNCILKIPNRFFWTPPLLSH